MTELWITDEIPARVLIVKGRSGIDPDCLVAELEDGSQKALWIIDDGGKSTGCYVCGLGAEVHARRIDVTRPFATGREGT